MRHADRPSPDAAVSRHAFRFGVEHERRSAVVIEDDLDVSERDAGHEAGSERLRDRLFHGPASGQTLDTTIRLSLLLLREALLNQATPSCAQRFLEVADIDKVDTAPATLESGADTTTGYELLEGFFNEMPGCAEPIVIHLGCSLANVIGSRNESPEKACD